MFASVSGKTLCFIKTSGIKAEHCSGNFTSAYNCVKPQRNITNINKSGKIKNITFEITDKRLIEKTGGVVQGMSGSPIIQNNKIFGAVTHVIVNNPTTGYGIFITTMLEEGEK